MFSKQLFLRTPLDGCFQIRLLKQIIFVEELKRVSLVDKYLVSFDVTSPFTSILLSKTIKWLMAIKTSQPDLNISEKDLITLLNM